MDRLDHLVVPSFLFSQKVILPESLGVNGISASVSWAVYDWES